MPSTMSIHDEFGLNDNLASAIAFEFRRLSAEVVVTHSPRIERFVDAVEVTRPGQPSAFLKGPMHLLLAAAARSSSLDRLLSSWRDVPVRVDIAYENSERTQGTILKRHLRSVAKSVGRSARLSPGNPHAALAYAAAEASLASNGSYLRDSFISPGAETRAGLLAFGRTAKRFMVLVERTRDYLPAGGPNGASAVRAALSEIDRQVAINQLAIDAFALGIRPGTSAHRSSSPAFKA